MDKVEDGYRILAKHALDSECYNVTDAKKFCYKVMPAFANDEMFNTIFPAVYGIELANKIIAAKHYCCKRVAN